MIRPCTFFPKLALGATAALASISLSPGSAQAYVVSVGGVEYDLSTYTFTPNQYTTNKLFLTPYSRPSLGMATIMTLTASAKP